MKTQTTKSQLDLTFTVLERAVIYARVSGDDTKKEERNIKGQLDMGREHCVEKGYRIVAELEEDPKKNTSGYEINLPVLNRIREMARNGEFDVLVVRELDRLSRNLAKQLIVEEELKRAGVRVEYVLAEYDDTPEGRLQKHIRATVSEYEREKIRERMVRGKQNKVKSGSVLVNNRPPYGYRSIKKYDKFVLEIDETEARIIRLIFEWYTKGEKKGQRPLSITRIVARLNEMHVPSPVDTGHRSPSVTKKRKKGEWCRSTVSRILKSETYSGIWHYNKATIKNGKWVYNPHEMLIAVKIPAIVGRDVWTLAQLRMEENKENAKRNLKYEYLMAKKVTCGCCGYKMASEARRQKDNLWLYYRCPARRNIDSTRECSLPTFPAKKVDDKIWEWVRSFFENEELLEAGIKRYRERNESETGPLKERLKVIDDLIKQHEKELSRLQRDYKAMKDSVAKRTKALLLNDIEEQEKTLDSLESQRNSVLAALEEAILSEKDLQAIRDYAAEVRAGLDIANASFPERRWLIEKLNVTVTLTVEDGQKIAYVQCVLGEDKPKRLQIETHNKSVTA